jgi:Ca2+-binding RTX toxin-like protein
VVAGYTTYLPNDVTGWTVAADALPFDNGSEGEPLTPAGGCVEGAGGDEVVCDVLSLPSFAFRGSAAADQLIASFEPCDDPTDCPGPAPRLDVSSGGGADVVRTSNGGRIDTGDGDDLVDIATLAGTPLTVDAGGGDDQIVDERSDPDPSTATVAITCGAGVDTVRFLQPDDTAAADCEHVYEDAGPPDAPPPDTPPGDAGGGAAGGLEPPCTVTGTPGDDVLHGTDGPDVVCGLGGDDVLSGLGGDDVLLGGDGDDALRGEGGADDLRGGDGSDLVTYLEAPHSMTVDLGTGRASGDGHDRLLGVERLRGSRFPDRLLGSAEADAIDGAGGDDLVVGRAGGDRLSGGAGDDRLAGGRGRDLLIGGVGRNALDGGAGSDACVLANGGRRSGCELAAA